MAPPLSSLSLDDLNIGADVADPNADPDAEAPNPYAGGALSVADIPGAREAMETLVRSSEQARSALQQAREKIAARKYSKAIALLSVGSALGAPTRTGSSAEGWSNAARALIDPIKEKQAFEENQQKELLGVDTSLAGLDERTATAQLQIAALRAKLANQSANAPLEKVADPGGTTATYQSRVDSRGKPVFVPPTASTNISLNTEKGFLGDMGAGASKLYNEQFQAALKAPEELERNARIRELLKKDVYNGLGAGWKLNFDRGLSAAGIDFGGDKIANTEQLATELAAGTLALIKPSGLGGGTGFSNTDREFIEKVAGGSYTLNKQTLEKLSRLHDRAQRMAIKQWNSSYSRLTKKPSVAAQLEMMGYEAIPLPEEQDAGTAAPATAPATEPVAPVSTVSAPPPGIARPAPAAGVPGTAGAPKYGLAPAEWSVDPADPPPRAGPAQEQYLKEHPETREIFVERYKYLPTNGR